MTKKKNKPMESKLLFKRENCWEKFDEKTKKNTFKLCDDYKTFLNNSKTERMAVGAGIKIARKNGFMSIGDFKKSLKSDNKKINGAKIYITNGEKNLALAVLGKDIIKDGANFIVSHIDSPHLDFKTRPLYEEESLAFLKTHYYGGIKKYHWPTIPLALHGVVITNDGKRVDINIGEKESDPIFMISDLLPHLGKSQLLKPLKDAVVGEELNIIVGSIPVNNKKTKERVKVAILKYLNDKYGMIEEDFFSAELQAVPAGSSRDLGFDAGLIAGYGQDDRVCSYTSIRALTDVKNNKKTNICFWTDKEEVGSDGVSGAQSLFLESLLLDITSLYMDNAGVSDVYGIFRKSQALSADVTAAYDPDYKNVHDTKNAARLGCGIAIEKYTGSGGKYSTSEASAEYAYKIRNIFNKNEIVWQTAGLGKVDEGGGGTIAKYLANRGVDTIDCGVALFNMHAPMEISSKADIYSSYLGYKAFYSN